ncbi:MAG: 7-carboxy-7-deazaguanine synthase QueE [Rubripirellula sp.]
MISPLGKPGFSHATHASARGTLRVAETFISRQGEGKLTGTDSFFIRTSGCNLRCWFCDTPYASWNPQGDTMSLEEIAERVDESGLSHVVLTGGEPMLPKDSVNLCHLLRQRGKHVTIETAGTIDREIECDLMSISPKFASSAPEASEHPKWNQLHQQRRMPLAVMRRLIDRATDYQLKFVVDSPADYTELIEIVSELQADSQDVWVMPQGSTIEAMDQAQEWLEPWCESQGYRYCDRKQIRWFGNRRGT